MHECKMKTIPEQGFDGVRIRMLSKRNAKYHNPLLKTFMLTLNNHSSGGQR